MNALFEQPGPENAPASMFIKDVDLLCAPLETAAEKKTDNRWSLDEEEHEGSATESVFAPVVMVLRGDDFVPMTLFAEEEILPSVGEQREKRARRVAKKRSSTHPWLGEAQVKEAKATLFDLETIPQKRKEA